jgi:hypothetical protein
MLELYTLIGDVVGSRKLPDRTAAQTRIGEALREVTEHLQPAQALEPTAGDEFQGAFTSLGTAVSATILVRLALLPEIDVRCGLGHGELTVHDASRTPVLQDGPAWWAARAALEWLDAPRRAARRTRYVGPDEARVNAYLTTRDALLERLGDTSVRMLALSLHGRSQKEIAAELGVTPSAVSHQVARGVGALREAHDLFEKGE